MLEKLSHRLEVMRLSQEIGRQTQRSMNQRQREYVLREQLKTIKKELGEDEGGNPEIDELRQAIAAAGMPGEALEQANRELGRLEHMPEAAAEIAPPTWTGSRSCLVSSTRRTSNPRARAILEADHWPEQDQARILEYLAVRKQSRGRSPILCFVARRGGQTSWPRASPGPGREFVRQGPGTR
jgi:ATP-dependent Lon protease